MTLSITKFAIWQEREAAISQARTWLNHIGNHGRGSDILRISPAHCKAGNFTLAGQYTEGGKNYWESPTVFDQAMKDVVISRFPELAAEAIARLEQEAAMTLIEAETEISAINEAIQQAKTTMLRPTDDPLTNAAPNPETDPRA